MHRLVCSGYATPGQSSWDLLDLFDLDILLDVAYGELVTGLGPEQRQHVDNALAQAVEAAEPDQIVEVRQKSTGNVIQISEARLAQIKRNMGAGGTIRRPKPGQEV